MAVSGSGLIDDDHPSRWSVDNDVDDNEDEDQEARLRLQQQSDEVVENHHDSKLSLDDSLVDETPPPEAVFPKTTTPLPRGKMTLKTTQADELRRWLYNNKSEKVPVLTRKLDEDIEELQKSTKLTKEEIHRWMNFALKKGVAERLFPVWRKKGEKVQVDERVSRNWLKFLENIYGKTCNQN